MLPRSHCCCTKEEHWTLRSTTMRSLFNCRGANSKSSPVITSGSIRHKTIGKTQQNTGRSGCPSGLQRIEAIADRVEHCRGRPTTNYSTPIGRDSHWWPSQTGQSLQRLCRTGQPRTRSHSKGILRVGAEEFPQSSVDKEVEFVFFLTEELQTTQKWSIEKHSLMPCLRSPRRDHAVATTWCKVKEGRCAFSGVQKSFLGKQKTKVLFWVTPKFFWDAKCFSGYKKCS